MFDIGFSELALIAILALLIAGPERLPGIMRGLGRIAGRARDVYTVMRTELEREMDSVKSEVTPEKAANEHTAGERNTASDRDDNGKPVDKDDGQA